MPGEDESQWSVWQATLVRVRSKINHIAVQTLDQFDIHLDAMSRWDGVMSTGGQPRINKDEM
jgi:hypothetical protein